jgi:hypothetical protein
LTAPDTTDLEIATRHVAEAEERCARQRALIEEMKADGQDTTGAENMLRLLEQSLDLIREHQQRLLDESQNRS